MSVCRTVQRDDENHASSRESRFPFPVANDRIAGYFDGLAAIVSFVLVLQSLHRIAHAYAFVIPSKFRVRNYVTSDNVTSAPKVEIA